MTIWLIGNSDDSRFDAHIAALKDACDRANISSRFLGPGSDLQAERRFSRSDDIIIWRYKMTPPTYPQSMNQVIYRFCATEWREVLFGICRSSGVHTLNGYEVITTSGNKPFQLFIAAECGFDVPRYAILNDKLQVAKFVENLGKSRVIRKPLAGYDIPDPNDMTRSVLLSPIIVSSTQLEETSPEQFSESPTLFQEYIEKQYELRIVAVGEAIITFKIDSQARERTKLDWRLGIMDDMYSLIDIDNENSMKIKAYLRRMGLFSGVFDFIVTPDGRLVFLECNPNGQWMWLDYLKPNYIADTFIMQACNINIS